MKEYEKWTAHIESKIATAKKKKERRVVLVKKLTAAVVCMALLSGSAFAVSYFMENDEPLYPTPDVTGTETKTTEDAVTETEPVETQPPVYEPPKIVTYKTEDGSYSWLNGQSSVGIGFSHEPCPEGHYDDVGFSSFHQAPITLVLLNGDLPDFKDFNELDLYYKKRRYESLGRLIAGKCNGNTVRAYIEEYDVTREEFDDNVDLVEEFAMNLDVLYGDTEFCDEYYKYTKIFERRREMYWSYRRTVMEIFDYENAPEGIARDSVERRRRFGYSIPELAYHYGLSEDELRHAIEESVKYTDYDLAFDYDYSVIYNEDGTFKDELSALDVRNNDFESVVNYAAELGEAFCRIYDWEDPTEIGDVKNEGREANNPYDCTGGCIDDLANRCEDMLEERGDKPYYPTGVLTDSPLPLKTLIDEYGLTREDVETAASEMTEEYDINYEVLFEGTMEDALEYYSSPKHRVKNYAAMTRAIMHRFIRTYYNDAEGTSLRMYGICSIPELALAGEISREELLAIIAEVRRREEASQVYYGGAFYQYDYDLDVIYNEDGSFKDLSDCDSGTLEAMFTGDERYIKAYAE